MQNILDQIVIDKQNEIASRKASVPQSEILERASETPATGSFLKQITAGGIRLIAEIKPKSPAAGDLAPNVDVAHLASVYARHAAAISVLTDHKYFGGSLEALREVSSNCSIPTLCKDFILDPYQVAEARLAGAEAVLLIVKILSDEQLRILHDSIVSYGMTPLVEIQTEEELERALAVQPQALLINNRNLTNFEIDLNTTERLVSRIPKSIAVVSASGIENKDDILRLSRFTGAFLVGSSLMRAEDPEAKLSELCRPLLIKTCGITSSIDASATRSLGADLVGVIFADNSPRKVSADQAKTICDAVGADKVVGVFQNQTLEEILALRETLGIKYVQLHGNEPPDMVRQLSPCIKAITIRSPEDIRRASEYAGCADFILFDRDKADNTLKWIESTINWINEAQPQYKFLFAGGLAPGNVRATIKAIKSDNLAGVDVASGIECSAGVKDLRLVQKFIMEARAHAIAG